MAVSGVVSRIVAAVLTAAFLCLQPLQPAGATPLLAAPPLGERWFAILMADEQVGFYRQQVTALPEGGFQIEGSGSVRMRVMGFSKEASSREVYRLSAGLALQTIEVEQTINGRHTRLTGKVVTDGLLLRQVVQGKASKRLLKFKGQLLAGPLLNLYPLLKGPLAGTVYRVQVFDPEEIKIKPVSITVEGEQATPDGQPAIKLRNDLYPFVENEIWVDSHGNTLLESVRDGLVLTRAEQPERLAAVVSGMALSQKDLIYDLSQVRAEPGLKIEMTRLTGLAVAIDGYGLQLPLLADGWQGSERNGERLVIRTGALRPGGIGPGAPLESSYLASLEGIEAASPAIIAQARQVVDGKSGVVAQAQALSSWTAQYLADTVDDSGSALAALEKKSGNCQSHAKLYTALARASGIPTRFVSGLVSRDGQAFLFHSWAESWLDGRWVAVDPTFDQLPADPTHLALFEGHTVADLAPLVGVIGRISIGVLEER
ncbi:MAG: transglutaminase-like domain-containing protein [Geobacter sp.]